MDDPLAYQCAVTRLSYVLTLFVEGGGGGCSSVLHDVSQEAKCAIENAVSEP